MALKRLHTSIKSEDGHIIGEDPEDLILPSMRRDSEISLLLTQMAAMYSVTSHGLFTSGMQQSRIFSKYLNVATSDSVRFRLHDCKWKLPAKLDAHALILVFQALDYWPDAFGHLLYTCQHTVVSGVDKAAFVALLVSLDGFVPESDTGISSASSCRINSQNLLLKCIDFTSEHHRLSTRHRTSEPRSVKSALTPLDLFLYALISAANGFISFHGSDFPYLRMTPPELPTWESFGEKVGNDKRVPILVAVVSNKSLVLAMMSTGGCALLSADEVKQHGFLEPVVRDSVMGMITSSAMINAFSSVLPNVAWLKLAYQLTHNLRDGLGMPCTVEYTPQPSCFMDIKHLHALRREGLCKLARSKCGVCDAMCLVAHLTSDDISCDKKFFDSMRFSGAQDMIGTCEIFQSAIAVAASKPYLIQLYEVSASEFTPNPSLKSLCLGTATPFLKCFIPDGAAMDKAFMMSYIEFMRMHRGMDTIISEGNVDSIAEAMAISFMVIKQEPGV